MLGGKEARAVQIMNDLGDRAHHTVLSAVPDALAARDAIAPGIVVDFPTDGPSLTGKPGLSRYSDIRAYMGDFDLVLSYNWGAMDGVMAHRMGGNDLPPIVHHEDGFNADEADKLDWKRNWFRRLAFPTLDRLIVPSSRLHTIARKVWKQPEAKIAQIANGIPVARYAGVPEPDALPGFERREGDVLIGTVAGLRGVKDLPRLVRAVARLPENAGLVIVGEGPERDAIEAEADRCGIPNRVLLTGFLDRPWRYIGHFDIFALSSRSEQFPISVVEAMAAGVPVVAPDVGDVLSMVSVENQSFIATDDEKLSDHLARLVSDPNLRKRIGAANRSLARAKYDEEQMLQTYRALYGHALGKRELFTR